MSIFKLAENIELERENNKTLRDAMQARIETITGVVKTLRSQAAAMENSLMELNEALVIARIKTMEELDARDEALRVIIEGEGHSNTTGA